MLRLVLLFACAVALSGQTRVPKLTETYRHYCFDFNWVDKLDPAEKPLSDYSKLSAQDHILALDALHIQHDVLPDARLTPDILAAYSLVILPNVACMTDAQARAIREYVRRGGSLLATAETSLFDENGMPRKDFALADVLGVKLDEPISNTLQTGNRKPPVLLRPRPQRIPSLLECRRRNCCCRAIQFTRWPPAANRWLR